MAEMVGLGTVDWCKLVQAYSALLLYRRIKLLQEMILPPC